MRKGHRQMLEQQPDGRLIYLPEGHKNTDLGPFLLPLRKKGGGHGLRPRDWVVEWAANEDLEPYRPLFPCIFL